MGAGKGLTSVQIVGGILRVSRGRGSRHVGDVRAHCDQRNGLGCGGHLGHVHADVLGHLEEVRARVGLGGHVVVKVVDDEVADAEAGEALPLVAVNVDLRVQEVLGGRVLKRAERVGTGEEGKE